MNLQSVLRVFSLRPGQLKLALLGSGLAGLGLYRLLYAIGLDGRGLLKSGHFAWVLLCVVSIAAGVLILSNTLRIRGVGGRPMHSIPAALACVAAALATLAAELNNLTAGLLFYSIPAALAGVAFLIVAVCRLRGRRPNFLLHVVICIHFALQLLKLYQTSSIDPQIQDYFFQLLACIFLTVTAYQLASYDLGRGQRRWLYLSALSAGYLCLVSLGSSPTGIYLAGAAWAFTAIPSPRRRKQQAEETPDIRVDN